MLISVILKFGNLKDKVFKNEPSKICGRQPLKNLKFLKDGLPQISLGPFLNNLSHIYLGVLKMELDNIKYNNSFPLLPSRQLHVQS